MVKNCCDDTYKDGASRNLTLRAQDDELFATRMTPPMLKNRHMMKLKAASSDVGRQSGGEDNEFESECPRSGSSS